MCKVETRGLLKPEDESEQATEQKDQDASSHEPTIFTPLIGPKDSVHKDAARLERGSEDQTERAVSSYVKELAALSNIAVPMVLMGLLLYSRTMVSMLFLGRLGEMELAGGSLAVGFANITGYSIISGLAMGMEPICGQAFGAKKHSLLGLTLQRTVLVLLCICFPISLLWLNMHKILLFCGQDEAIIEVAQSYITYSLPDLFAQTLLHPLRIYLRTQNITMPITYCALAAMAFHVPINYLLVTVLNMGIRGVALSAAWTNINIVLCLLCYILFSNSCSSSWVNPSRKCLKGWRSLLSLAVPSCVSVCLEWWWYEIMILLCGLLLNPKATVASMGILIQTTSLIYIFPSSLSFGVSTRVSNELGAKQPEKAKKSVVVGLCCSFVLGFAALFFTTMVRKSWARMYTGDGEILRITARVLPIIGLCELGNCPQTTGCGVLRGTARPTMGAHINLGCFYLIGMPAAVGLVFFAGFDFEGLWMGLMAAQGSCVVAMMVVIWRTDWSIEAERAQFLTSKDGLAGRRSVGEASGGLVSIKIVEQ